MRIIKGLELINTIKFYISTLMRLDLLNMN